MSVMLNTSLKKAALEPDNFFPIRSADGVKDASLGCITSTAMFSHTHFHSCSKYRHLPSPASLQMQRGGSREASSQHWSSLP